MAQSLSSVKRKKTFGKSAFNTIMINTVIPFLFVYGKAKDDIMAYRYSYSVIKRSKVFGLNLPTIAMLDTVKKIGTSHSDEVDKFQENKLSAFEGKVTKVPLIEECFINMECKIINELKTGDHDIFIAEPVSLLYDEDVFIESRFSKKYKEKNNQIHITDALPEFV